MAMKLSLFCLSMILFIGLNQAQNVFTLSNKNIVVAVDANGNLNKLSNSLTGYNYASNKGMWRLYFDTKSEKENQVTSANNQPSITQRGNQITIRYETLHAKTANVSIRLTLTISLEDSLVRFASTIVNNQPHTIIREFQYPLIGNCKLPKGYELITTEYGGQKYKDVAALVKNANQSWPPYYPPSQYFLQRDTRYPYGPSSNCFVFAGALDGLYVASHDTTFGDTGHGLRLYPSKKSVFDELEIGMYKYPNCLYGQTWSNKANVLAPYSGTWHVSAHLYRSWVNTWWQHKQEPQWVREMKGWQRIIMKHQYGEVLFPYSDLGTRVKKVGEGVGLNTVFVHGWHQTGHDNNYPDYLPDTIQGGVKELKKQIAQFQKNGGAAIWYYSGRLIDKTSKFYTSGLGKKITIKDNTGSEFSDNYKFRGMGTFTGDYNSRTFTVADFRSPIWRKELLKMADQAIGLGVKSVFYDQMGGGDFPNWDLSKEFPVPNLFTLANKATVLKELQHHIRSKDTSIAMGIEMLTDLTSMYSDYIHWYGPPSSKAVINWDWEARGEKPITSQFIDWFRYTFPEIIISDRDIRDDNDIERRVNHTVLKGLRNDVEIYRCRALIDETPIYQAYLTKINQLKDRYKDVLLQGKYTDVIGFTHSNIEVDASRFENGNKAAIVFTQSHLENATTMLSIPEGYQYKEFGAVGDASVVQEGSKLSISIPKKAIVVVLLVKKN